MTATSPRRAGAYPRIKELEDIVEKLVTDGHSVDDEAAAAHLTAQMLKGLTEEQQRAIMTQLLTGYVTEMSEEGARAGTHRKNADGTYTRIDKH